MNLESSSLRTDIKRLLNLFDGTLNYHEYPLTEHEDKLMERSEWELRYYLKEDRWPNEEEKKEALTEIARGGTPLEDLKSAGYN